MCDILSCQEEGRHPSTMMMEDQLISPMISRHTSYQKLVKLLIYTSARRALRTLLTAMILTVLSSIYISIFCGQCSLASLSHHHCPFTISASTYRAFQRHTQVRGTLMCLDYSEVEAFLKLILVLPSTNVVSEWSLSAWAAWRHLQATMKLEQLSHLLLLHVHKDHTEKLALHWSTEVICWRFRALSLYR